VSDIDSLDAEANTLLGTIYQRLGNLVRSDQALRRVLDRRGLDRNARAEVHSLLGRNAKSQWTNDWRPAAALAERQERALRSPYLDEALEAYAGAFNEDLNHFYSGLNALAMLTIQTELAQLLPTVWADMFDDATEAERELESRRKKAEKLSSSVELSLKAADTQLKREKKTDIWAEISEADHCFLTSKRPGKVTNAYRRALVGAPPFAADAVRGQLVLYQELGLLQANVTAALEALAPAPSAGGAPQPAPAGPTRVLLFTGHMIDAPGREKPRFPNKQEMIDAAKRKIAEKVAEELAQADGNVYGVAGCASGGDILFHQVCEKAGIPTRIFLALPRNFYIQESVAHAGPEWVEEFKRLVKAHPVRVLGESKELPGWLQDKQGYGIWQRNNLWTLHNALAAAGGDNVTLIALWDRASKGDGPGGTADMVEKALERGAKTFILDTNTIFAQ